MASHRDEDLSGWIRPAVHERRRFPRQAEGEDRVPPLPPVLHPLAFSTRALPPERQFDAWRTHMAPLADVLLPDGVSPVDGFPADHTTWNLGEMLIVQQQTPAYRYIRSAAKLRSSPIDHWYLAALRTGSAWTEVDGHVVRGEPGTIELHSLGHPFRGRTTECSCIVIYLPRDLFADVGTHLDAKNNTAIRGNFANIVLDYLGSVETRLAHLTSEDVPRIVHTVRELVVASVFSSGHEAPSEHLSDMALMERARRHIQQNLRSHDLTLSSIGRELGVSRSRLYQLFEPSGGVLHYIQKRRLLAAHAALSDPADGRRIVDIAEAVGFSSAANFSRAFSHEFGYSPRDARNSPAWPSLVHSGAAADDKDGASFEALLRNLGNR